MKKDSITECAQMMDAECEGTRGKENRACARARANVRVAELEGGRRARIGGRKGEMQGGRQGGTKSGRQGRGQEELGEMERERAN